MTSGSESDSIDRSTRIPYGKFSDSGTHKIRELELQAVILLEDGLAYREIHHVLHVRDLRWYRMYKRRILQNFFNAVISLLLLIIFVEKPSSFSYSSDPASKFSKPSIELSLNQGLGFELFFLIIIFIDFLLNIYFYRLHWGRKNVWIWTFSIIIIYSFVEAFVNYVGRHEMMYRKILRPFFMVRRSTLVKQMLKSLVRSVGQMLSVLFLLICALVTFTLVGLLLFAETEKKSDNSASTEDPFAPPQIKVTEGNQYFSGFRAGLENLLILATTANNPTVTMPAYADNRLNAIFFILFLLTGIILTNIFIAIIYYHFVEFFEDSVKSSVLRRRVAFRACFCCLQELELVVSHFHELTLSGDHKSNLEEESQGHTSEESPGRGGAAHEGMKDEDIAAAYQQIKFEGGPDVKVHVSKIEDCIRECAIKDISKKEDLIEALQKSTISWFSYDQFLKLLCAFLEAPKERKPKPFIVPAQTEFLKYIQKLVISAKSNKVRQFYNLFYFIFTAATASYVVDDNPDKQVLILYLCANLLLVIFYSCHAGSQIWAYGWRRYISSWIRVYEMLTMGFVSFFVVYQMMYVFITDRAHLVMIKFLVGFIFANCVGSMVYIKQISLIMRTIKDLILNLIPFWAVFMCCYYSFGVLGMILFKGIIKHDKLNRAPIRPSYFPTIELPCGSYEQMEYWPTNFNDFYSALVLLWDIMIVNNWNVFLDVFTRRSGTEFAKVYFIVWWLLSNILLLNLMTSLTIETLMLRISLDKESKLMSANPSQATAAMDSNLDFLEPHHGNEGAVHEDDPEVGVSDNQDEMGGDVLYNYSSIYDIIVHIKKLTDPEDLEVIQIIHKHPERHFPTLPKYTEASSSASRQPSIVPGASGGDAMSLGIWRESSDPSYLSLGSSNGPLLASRRCSSFGMALNYPPSSTRKKKMSLT